MSPTNGLKRATIIVPVVGVVLIVSMVARPLPGEQTPWEFFRDAVPDLDSIGKGLSLAFFTTVLTFMNFMAVAAKLRLSLLLPIALIALVSLAGFSPAVRAVATRPHGLRSRCARIGAAHQFGRPTGFSGRVVGWIMASRPSNRRRNVWTVSLLDVRRHDRVLEIGFGPGIAIREISGLAVEGLRLRS